jgi:hypothetical protein
MDLAPGKATQGPDRMDRILIFALAVATSAGLSGPASAVDLSGAWATHADECSSIFIRKGRSKQIGFTLASGQHGGGFVVEADRLRGKGATCKIKSRKEDGQTVNFIAACATDIMLSDVQFSLKLIEADKLLRTFPGIEGVEINYYRCTL